MSAAVSAILFIVLMALVGIVLSAFFTKKTVGILLGFWVVILGISVLTVLLSPGASLQKALTGTDETGLFILYYGFILGLAIRYIAFSFHPFPLDKAD